MESYALSLMWTNEELISNLMEDSAFPRNMNLAIQYEFPDHH